MARFITKAEGGNMRSQHRCPCCGSRAKVVAKVSVTNRLFTQQVACLNPLCGWTGLSNTEYTRTISPPSALFGGTLDEPPLMSEEEVRQINAAEEAQQELI